MFSGKNLLASILIGLLFISALASLVCVVVYTRGSGELRGLQTQAARMESSRNLLRALAADSIEYSKKNPAIDPLLQSVGLKQAAASPKATK